MDDQWEGGAGEAEAPVVGEVGVPAAVRSTVKARRRKVPLVVVVLAIVVVLGLVGAGALVAFRMVVARSGGPSPVAAVQGVFNATGEYADADALQVLRYLCPEHADELRARVVKVRAALVADHGTRLALSGFRESRIGGGVQVSVQVSSVTPMSGPGGLFGESTEHEWRFVTVGSGDDWRVCGWDAPDVCAVYVNCP